MSNPRFLLALSVLPFLLVVWAGPSLAEDPEPLWTEEVGRPGHIILSFAARGGQLLVAGQTGETGAPYFLDSFVAARDARTGELDWERPLEGKFSWMRVFAHGGRVYAITTGDESTLGHEARVVALRARDGEILWEDRIPNAAQSGARIFVLPGAKRTVAIAPLDLDPPEGSTRRHVGAQIRAYDARGERKWDLTLGGASPEWDFEVKAAAMRGRLLWIAGSVESDWVVRCYDALDGTVEWEDRFSVPDALGAPDSESLSESADLLALRGRTLVVAGTTRLRNEDPIVRAYEAREGRVLWTYTSSEDEYGEYAHHIAVIGSKTIIAWHRNSIGWATRLDSFDVRTGALLSQLPLDVRLSGMAPSGHGVVLGGNLNGTANQPEDGEPFGFVMGIDARGALLPVWEAHPFWPVWTVGTSGPLAFASFSWHVAAYDPR